VPSRSSAPPDSEPELPPVAEPEPAPGSEPRAPSDADPEQAHEPEAAATEAPPEGPAPEGEAVETMLRRYLSLPPVRITSRPPPPIDVDREASTMPPSRPKTPKVDQVDAKLAEVEALLETTNWGAVVDVLAKAESLTPPLALLYAIALRERDAEGDADGIAIRAAAALLCVPEDSETALVVAKRILRRNPVAWKARPAPPVRVSVAIVVAVLVLGALAGFLAGPGGLVLR
jgi:hypothetical protein